MPNSHPPVICRYCPVAGQWQAWFDGAPDLKCGADLPMRAVCLLLEGSDTEPSAITLYCDRDMVGSGVLVYEPMWKPPELLFLVFVQ